MSKKIIGSMIFAAVVASGTANAAISTETTINFNSMTAGTSGFANNGPIPLDALIAPGPT